MSPLPLSARLRSPFVSVSSILVTIMSLPIVVRAFVGPRPVYSRVHCTTAFEMAADSSPSTVLIRKQPFGPPLGNRCTRARRRGDENLTGDHPRLAAHSGRERPAPCHS